MSRFPNKAESRQVFANLSRCLVAFANVIIAGLQDDRVQLKECFALGHCVYVRWQIGILESICAGARFIKHLAQAVEISLRRPRTLGRDVTLCAETRLFASLRYQPNICQFRAAFNEDNVRWLDV